MTLQTMSFLEMSLSGAILITIITLLRLALRRYLPQQSFTILWLLALLRLLTPFTLSLPWRFPSVLHQTPFSLSPSNNGIANAYPMPYAEVAISENTIAQAAEAVRTLSPWFIIWIMGAIGLATFFLLTHFRCRLEYDASLPLDDSYINAWLSDKQCLLPVQVRHSDRIAAPLSYGIWRPVILLPKSLDLNDREQLGYILSHELSHIRRGDILTKTILIAALSVHWFNPAVWLMYLLANCDIELSCDSAVVRLYGENSKAAYALTLIHWEEKLSGFAPLCNSFSEKSTEERIRAIMSLRKTSLTSAFLSCLLILGLAATFAISAAEPVKPQAEASAPMAYNGTTYIYYGSPYVQPFAIYKEFGLTYDAEKQQLRYHDELVRYFSDWYEVGEGGMAGMSHYDEHGIVDVYAVRDHETNRYNPDGSFDPSGILLCLRLATDEEYQDFDAEELTKSNSPSATTVSSADDSLTPEYYSELYSVYLPFGLTYDIDDNCNIRFTYQGQSVRFFLDVLSSNGESFEGGKFKGSMRSLVSDEEGTIDLFAVRDYAAPDAEGNGKLVGFRICSQEEFDARTQSWQQAAMEQNNPIYIASSTAGSTEVVTYEFPYEDSSVYSYYQSSTTTVVEQSASYGIR